MECVKNRTRQAAGTGVVGVSCLVLLAAMPLAGCSRLSQHPLVVAAVEEVSGNARVAEMLGKPVTCGTAVRGTANETDGIASLQFDARGPQGSGIVVVEGKKTQGAWGVTHLELRPPNGAALQLTADLEARVGVDTRRTIRSEASARRNRDHTAARSARPVSLAARSIDPAVLVLTGCARRRDFAATICLTRVKCVP